ncbi:MAG: bifunctional metallophosphatase/5'-nucleotidase, partial [Deltaproteobacteria bacterium]|nr:bifunctional metallophosphatase/5'-nucleotidase [Deltaproteobacteria bacterium]
MRAWARAALLAALAAGACVEQHDAPDLTGQDVRVAFLHTSDMHGRLLPYRMQVTLTDEELGLRQELEPFGGIARVAHLVDRERARG